LDFHQQSVPTLPCHNQMLDNFGADLAHQALHPNYEQQLKSNESPMSNSFFMGDNFIEDSKKAHEDKQQMPQNPYNAEQMQEFLLQKFSSQDFDLLTKNYDFFLQYYKANCPSEQLMDDKHLSMDFLTQFYHLSEFKRKLNGADLEQESNMSDDDGNNDNDDVVALDDLKDESDANQPGTSANDMSKGKVGVTGMHNNKRLRTTILPEQLNYLYECYQKESNPSRKQLEEIAKKVNLKKRVVQVRNLVGLGLLIGFLNLYLRQNIWHLDLELMKSH
jgi:Homeodomain